MGNRLCPVCGMGGQHILKKIEMDVPESYHLPKGYNVVACTACGMVYADTSASMDDYSWYYTHCNFYGDDTKDDGIYSNRYSMIEDLLGDYLTKESKLLELGAGNGTFAVSMKLNGYNNITATDPAENSIRRLQEQGINAYVADIYSPVDEKEQGKYDGVFLFEVAEHLLKPGIGIAHVEALLNDHGYFVVSVPDYSTIEDSPYNIANYFNLEHINYYSENSLDILMARYHLRRVGQKKLGEDLIQVYQKTTDEIFTFKDEKTQIVVKKYLEHQDMLYKEQQEKVRLIREQGNELVIWGAGSYAMSLLATTALKECRIAGFVDNNKIKQGRKFCNYEVHAPEYLRDKKYTVVICSMLYSQEIKEQLDNMHTENQGIIL